jgi:hypothetical protein
LALILKLRKDAETWSSQDAPPFGLVCPAQAPAGEESLENENEPTLPAAENLQNEPNGGDSAEHTTLLSGTGEDGADRLQDQAPADFQASKQAPDGSADNLAHDAATVETAEIQNEATADDCTADDIWEYGRVDWFSIPQHESGTTYGDRRTRAETREEMEIAAAC